MEEWKEYKARDFCQNVTDGTHDSPKPKSEGYYLITSKHLKDNCIDFSSAYLISKEDYLKVISRSAVEQYDILYSMIGTIGNVVQVKRKDVDFAVKNMGIFKMGKNSLKSSWLYYWLKSPYALAYVNQRLAGSTQSYLTLNSLREYPILYPGDKIAKKIISILKPLDDKIEVNRRINENLEQQAQALFKSWFVDFEPFKDGEFVESELGMIPKGWRVGKLGDLVDIIKPSIKPQGNLVYSHYSIPAFDESQIPSSDIGETIKSNKFSIQDSVTLLSKLNPEHKRIWYVNKVEANAICSTEFLPFYAKNREQSAFVYCYLNSSYIYREIANGARGTTNSHQRIDAKAILSRDLAYNNKVISLFCNIVGSILEQRCHASQESRRLASLRDTLLPRLMSGELKVNEIETKIL